MRGLFVTAMLVLGLVLGACGGTEEELPQPVPADELGKADLPDCTYKCVKCLPPKAPACDFLCFYVGKCDTRCTTFEYCNPGFVWNDIACRCLPDK